MSEMMPERVGVPVRTSLSFTPGALRSKPSVAPLAIVRATPVFVVALVSKRFRVAPELTLIEPRPVARKPALRMPCVTATPPVPRSAVLLTVTVPVPVLVRMPEVPVRPLFRVSVPVLLAASIVPPVEPTAKFWLAAAAEAPV